jgi:hypothetical protein
MTPSRLPTPNSYQNGAMHRRLLVYLYRRF